jgi:Fem-1 family protein b
MAEEDDAKCHIRMKPFSFPDAVYRSICTKAKSGDNDQLIDILSTYDADLFDSDTFCPDPKRHVGAPVVLAAQYGHFHTVKYFFDKYTGLIDINHGATIVSRTTQKKVHHATALWAACTGGHLEVVKYLVERGADVNKTTLTQSTPLRGASFHGFISIMEYLIQCGANINTPNCIGQSPLCIAAMRGELDAVKFLIDKGANVNQTTINSYSIMHLAAAKGKDDVIKYLLEVGVSPQFQEADPYISNYVPCPLFLAASTGQAKAVEVLLEHKDCSVACLSDAKLLIASMHCEMRKRLRVTEPKIQNNWEEGLKIRQEHSIQPKYLEPIEEYGNRQEIQTEEELSQKWFDVDFIRRDVFYQSLLIRERCMGFRDQSLIYFLVRRGSHFCQEKRFKEAELLWFRAMKMEMNVCEAERKNPEFGHCEGTLRDLEKDLNVYSDGICSMIYDNYTPCFARYISYGLEVLQLLSRLTFKADSEIITYEPILGLVMEMFLSWIIHSNDYKGDGYQWNNECNLLGQQFVSKYLHYTEDTTLLHIALTNFIVSENDDRRVFEKFSDLRPLITALLCWGADEVINLPNAKGLRPLHIAAQLSTNDSEIAEVLSPLIDGGAHLDAVDSNGFTVYDHCLLDVSKVILFSCGPSTLSCYAARAIIRESIDYSTALPHHMQEFVKIHDKTCIL